MNDLVIIDTETTGWNHNYHRVIEVAAVRVVHGEIIDTYSSLIKTSASVPRFITQLTGITKRDLNKEGKEPEIVFPEIRSFIGDSTFVAHNVNFDYRFLNAEFERLELQLMENPRLCTVRVARRSNLPIPNFKLTTIKEFLQLDYKSHRALNDVMVCYELLKQTNYQHVFNY